MTFLCFIYVLHVDTFCKFVCGSKETGQKLESWPEIETERHSKDRTGADCGLCLSSSDQGKMEPVLEYYTVTWERKS